MHMDPMLVQICLVPWIKMPRKIQKRKSKLKGRGLPTLTPLMERVHKIIPQSAETSFVDSTSNLDQINSTFVWLFHRGTSFGVIISNSQDQECCKKVFFNL